MAVNIDRLFYWYSKVDPTKHDKETVRSKRCTCAWCVRANDRAFEESYYGTPHLLEYFNDRGMSLAHGTRINNSHIIKALEILHSSYRKVLQPARLECLAGAFIKTRAGYDRADQLGHILPWPIFNSLYDYVSDCKHIYGNFARLHEEIPSWDEYDALPIMMKHVKKYIVTEDAYGYTF